MSERPQNLYTKYVDYEQKEELPIHDISDDKAIKPITADNFEMEKRKLGEILTNQKFKIPEYQRVFSWKEKQLQQFWTDIEKFVKAELIAGKEDVSDVFFSTMYFAADSDIRGYEIIDGQQRLTTTHILLRVLMEHLESIDPDSIADDTIAKFRGNAIRQIEDILYVHESLSGPTPRLTLNKHDAEFFKAIMMGPEVKLSYLLNEADYDIHGNNRDAIQVDEYIERFGISDEEVEEFDNGDLRKSSFFKLYRSHRRLLRAYEFYNEKISNVLKGADTSDDAVRALLNISNFIQHSYHVGEYIIREAESDFRMQIFEILNDRGVELTKIDRIRAAVVNAFYDTEYKKEYVEKWENIVVAFATDEGDIDDFLSIYLSIVDESINQIGDASSELTNAFDTRNIDPESEVEPRLGDIGEARNFIDFSHDLVGYYQDITNSDLEPNDLKLSSHQQKCQEILIRLNSQQMNQWRPLVLYLYYYTDEQSKDDARRFYHVLDTIEKLNFRRLLIGEDPNIFQEVFIAAVHDISQTVEGDETTENVYERSAEHLINEIQSKTPSLFGDRFIGTITRSQSWNPRIAKMLFAKIANSHLLESDYVEARLKMENIHLEHVLPQNLVHDTSNPIWLYEFFKVEESEFKIVTEVQRYLELICKDQDELDDDDKEKQKDIEEYIKQRFVNDIGNFVLLRGSDNISASDRPFVEKIPRYYNEKDDFKIIHPNRYFTSEHGAIDSEPLEHLIQQFVERSDGNRERIDGEIASYFNSFWTFESMQERRVELLLDILECLSFDELTEDEFGLKTDSNQVEMKIREDTRNEFNDRLSMSLV